MRALRVGLLVVWVVVVVMLAGCADDPQAPEPPRKDLKVPTVVRTTVPALCEKNWLYANDGDWDDPFEWLPSGVPTVTDDVCISGPGTYTITVASWAGADSVYIGPGVNVTFEEPTSTWGELVASEEIVVDTGASLTFRTGLHVEAASIINDGSVIVRDSASAQVDDIDNRSYFELSTAVPITTSSLINVGDLYTTTASVLRVAQRAELAGGRVLGPGTMSFDGLQASTRFVWSGGQLGQRSRASDTAQVSVSAATVVLDNTSLSGALDIANADTLVGDVGAAVSLKLLLGGSLRMTGVGASNTPVVNRGAFLVDGVAWGLEGARQFENRGELTVLSGTMYISTAAFDNRGTVRVKSGATLQLGIGSPTTTHNSGAMTVDPGGTLQVVNGTYHVTAPGTQSGQVVVDGGTVTGNGRLDAVRVTSGVVAPGPGISTLTFNTLTLTSGARLEMDAAGPAVFDRIRVDGEATYRGQLDVLVAPTYVGGVCGQVLPMFTDRNSLTAHAPGAFQVFAHRPAALGKYWRAHYARDSVIVAGYDPSAWATVTPLSGTLAEGGPSRTGQLCMNAPVTGANVVAQLSAARSQFTVTPTLTFTSANYALPQLVQVTAVDDAASEGPHGDTLRVALTQGGAPFGGTAPSPTFPIADNDPAVDLTVSMVSANNPVVVGQTLERRFRVTNVGPGASTGSTFSIPALSGVTFLANGTGASCTIPAGTLTCTVGALASGSSTEFVVLFTAPAVAGTYANTLRIRGNDWDNVASNNTAPWALTVN